MTGQRVYAILGVVTVVFLTVFGWAYSSSRATSGSPVVAPAQPPLELEASSAERSYGWIKIEGMVKNVSDQPLEHVQAGALLFDAKGDFVTSDWSVIDYSPILAGQSSPFSVLVRDNPAIDTWQIQFREGFGGQISHSDKRN